MQKLKYICAFEDCTGCMACVNACAHSAIDIEITKLGFQYPYINLDKCVSCGLCYKVCPSLNIREKSFPTSCFAVTIKHGQELLNCASGGAATALSTTVLRNGGVVVGCSGEDMTHVKHIIVDNEDDLYKLQGSKYVQSEISDTLYREIRHILSTGRQVLFIGTGCQVAGLQNFLIKPYENLITVDLVCHGVPSQQMLCDNIKEYKNIDPSTIKFRIKTSKPNGIAIRFGWSSTIHTDGKNETIFVPSHKDPYMAAFLDLLSFRECCYRCKYAYSARQSNLTICDFWGLGKFKPSKMNPQSGVSAILINNKKGQKAFENTKGFLNIEERELLEVIEGNNQLRLPSKRNPLRAEFEKLYFEKGFKVAVEKTTIRNNKIRRVLLIPEKIMRKIGAKIHIYFR